MKILRAMITAAAVAATVPTAMPAAAQVVLEGNYIRVGIGTRGTLGVGGATSPGLIHDPSGTGTFNPATDYITPGVPHEGFSFNSTQTGFVQNDNDNITGFGTGTPILLAGAAAEGYDNAASWTGANSFLSITSSFFFNDGDERILIRTVISAIQNLTNLAFARSVDPDSGTTTSFNQRGTSALGINDFVGSESAANGRTLALVNLNGNALTHTTQINASCCSNINPYNVLANTGGDLGTASTGDHGLNLAYLIGNLNAGSSATLTYAYAVGESLEDAGTGGTGGPTSAVPEPATWAMMMLGFGVVGTGLRRRKGGVKAAIA